MRTILVGGALCLGLMTAAAAAPADDGLPTAFVCEFATGFFSAPDGERLSTVETGDALGLTYASIDQAGGTAQMIGNAGARGVMFLRASWGVHFLEVTAAGNVTLTTVYTSPSRKGRFYASHSQHIGSETDPIMSHYLGLCEPRSP